MSVTAAERTAMLRALELAATPGVPLGPNPRVGCVLLADDGRMVAEGFHRGAGTPHAEADALARAGAAARGSTAVVTLEPCNHTGRTGPCAQALVAAGVRRVVFAQPDPNPVAAGGADTLLAAGVEVESGLLEEESRALNRVWTFATERGRPFVTWKFATTLDGRSAAPDGTSRWVSGLAARRDSHRLRALCDVMLVGTNTVAVDDPRLTVRDEHDRPLPTQPLRVVMGERDVEHDRRIFDETQPGGSLHLRTRDPRTALAELRARERQHVFLEGGPTLAAAFLRAGLVDEIVAYVAPMLLGAGRSAVGDLGITTIADALRPVVTDVTVLPGLDGEQPDVRLTMTPQERET
ncbi:bifunctional diaminohydroxyphosphoribosylaminopyrimidine deaminase/5-amino-6-(5-phosphoribosylamino)uracil reductase RibD [Nocardioides sp. cx-173]|uniref:bifunctional diaminohydroxyphosphoribosylaminopyrimidine deaminase/5-amino-6-(5-phosphoribosylamino)uracil reductase RibD n=1 Tax=Nocardioides sp. cx-173 TaxID=2898796 RepID=UPI001E4E7F92|nr:bifunctional diaminohydroxyphosphoribosylaminopyrimidine deaminase/5-amino-6-(5-phosphoribosylamino)uracil reductase RibD [Nocardioides sp. cx-173]MCD4526102.1 bifunctional diaminohydroxyphosphoribosylaminopyrimidine deaminase/5-amino-6-(5-phosphoribosylamino)uracil reductase RibD [Nocardioides sp. cx-173]UGB43792.1 bifunctional diaminohydroxyphosphoribosylaminopyrimidine deaminase/5-amino-6-(5-phosphoribosylamino)uracil reductase RibD [Nocardioides sp. cx-173]